MATELPPPDVVAPSDDEPVFVITRKQWNDAKAAAGHFIPTIAKYWPIITNMLIATGLITGGAVYVLKPDKPLPVPSQQPVTVVVSSDGKSATSPVEPIPIGSKDSPRVAPKKLVIYTTDAEQVPSLGTFDDLPVQVSIDPKTWDAGTYKFGDKTVVFPAGVLYSLDLKSIFDVVHFDSTDDLIKMVKKNSKEK